MWLDSDMCLSFPAAEDAQHAKMAIDVDEELQPDKIHRMLSVDGSNLIVCVIGMIDSILLLSLQRLTVVP